MKLIIEGLELIADDLHGKVALYSEGEVFAEVLPSHGNSASHNAKVLISVIEAHDQLVAALTEARVSVQANRDSLYECHYQPHTGDVDAAGREAVDEDDALLSRIDAAIAKATGSEA